MKKLSLLCIGALFISSTAFAELSDVCSSVSRRGYLWKPASQDSGPPREGRPMILFTSANPGKSRISIYAADGTKICSFARYAGGNRYYSGTGCKKSAAQIRTLARAAAGSENVYIEGKGSRKCLGPEKPTQRGDRR